MRNPAAVLFAVLLLLSSRLALADAPAPEAPAPSAPPATLFDPAKHMLVSEVHPGMKGYGQTVFSGSKIERFDVEVIDVMKNFNPKYDAILIRCKGEYMEHVGSVEGMSGSPIYLYDDTGKARLVGAFAYGWPLAKDPIAGVQPIEYMLRLPVRDTTKAFEPDGTAAVSPADASHLSGTGRRPHWSLDDLPSRPWDRHHAAAVPLAVDSGAIHLQPLATPLMVSGLSPQAVNMIAPLFQGSGLVPMQSGGGGESGSADPSNPPKFEPGSVLAVPLLTGDVEMTAIGTCTEVIGDRIFGFGHPFNGEGPIDLPMGTGSIATIVANLQSSFKLGFLSKVTGTLTTDQSVGVAGRIGNLPPMIPIELRIVYKDGSVDEVYHFSCASHPKFTPMIAGAAVAAALAGEKQLPEYHTVDYDLTMDFANGQPVHVVNRSVNNGAADITNDVGLPLMAALENPFRRVDLSKLSGTITVSDQAQSADILAVTVPRSKYQPGETMNAFVSYHPFHAEESIIPIQLELPRDLPNGTYQLAVSDWQKYLEEERTISPFRFTADNADELFQVIKDVMAVKHNALYVRLIRQPDGVAVGRVAMPRLPSSARQVLTDSGRSDIVPFVSSMVKVVPTDLVMSGEADFSITIEKEYKVEVAPVAGTKSDDGSKTSGH